MSSDENDDKMSGEHHDSSSSESYESNDRTFGQKFAELLNTELPDGCNCPILCFSKIPQRIKKDLKEKRDNEKFIQISKKLKAKEMNKFHKPDIDFNDEFEKMLKKIATKGIITRLNQISTSQSKVEEDTVADGGKTPEHFLSLLKMAAAKD